MANTRKSLKRSKVENKRNLKNQRNRTEAKTAMKAAIAAIQSKDAAKAKEAFSEAIKTLAKSASKGAFHTKTSSRKISRLALFAKKTLPELFAKSQKS